MDAVDLAVAAEDWYVRWRLRGRVMLSASLWCWWSLVARVGPVDDELGVLSDGGRCTAKH